MNAELLRMAQGHAREDRFTGLILCVLATIVLFCLAEAFPPRRPR